MFDSRYSLAKLSQSAHSDDMGIPNASIGRTASERIQELERNQCPWRDSFIGVRGGLNGTDKPKVWTDGDTFLRTQLATKVLYEADKQYPSGETVIFKKIGRYSSPLAQDKLRHFPEIKEQDLLKDVDFIDDSLDLRKTTITTVPKLITVRQNLTLDTNSKLESMPNLRRVDGKISVIAKNREEMDSYLRKLGIIDENRNVKVYVGKNIEFIMRSYN